MNLNAIENIVVTFLNTNRISSKWINAVMPYIRLAFAGNDYYVTDILKITVKVNEQFNCLDKVLIDTKIYFPNSKETRYGYIEYIFTYTICDSIPSGDCYTIREIGHKVTHYFKDDFGVNVLELGIPYTNKKWYTYL